MPLPNSVIEEIRRIVGRESVIDSANDLRIFERDASIEGALPDAVVLPSTTEQVAGVIGEVMKFVPKERIVACTNCGMAPMRRDIATAKLAALGAGATLARKRYG